MRAAASILLAVGLLSACASSRGETKAARFLKAVERYNKAFRWKNYAVASDYLPQDRRALFITTYEDDDKSLSISDYRILKVDKASEDEATVSVRYRYTMLPSTSVKKRLVTQHWYHVGEAWRLEGEDDSIRELKLPENSDSPATQPADPGSDAAATPPAEPQFDTAAGQPASSQPSQAAQPEAPK